MLQRFVIALVVVAGLFSLWMYYMASSFGR